MTDAALHLDDHEITRTVTVSPTLTNTDHRDLVGFATALGRRAPFDTGLLPPGLLVLRQAGYHRQLVFQLPPAIYHTIWGRHEGDPSAGTYLLAQPWRIVIADYHHDQLGGARMFYTPQPVVTLDQPLYHANVPNLNCRGYSGTGVGWICLYPRSAPLGETIAVSAANVLQRCSGMEAYNDANMSQTDGPRFYQANHKPAYTWDPAVWEAKSRTEGVDWTLDETLWLPILVDGAIDRHVAGGVPLTLAMAMHGPARVHYHDKDVPKLTNALAAGTVGLGGRLMAEVFTPAFVAAATLAPPGAAVPAPPAPTVVDFVFDDDEEENLGPWCGRCENVVGGDGGYSFWDDYDNEELLCFTCMSADDDIVVCSSCVGLVHPTEATTMVPATVGADLPLCPDCTAQVVAIGGRACPICRKVWPATKVAEGFHQDATVCLACAAQN